MLLPLWCDLGGLAQKGIEGAHRHHRGHGAGDRLAHGLVDNKVCAIDTIWAGLRVVWRKDRRT